MNIWQRSCLYRKRLYSLEATAIGAGAIGIYAANASKTCAVTQFSATMLTVRGTSIDHWPDTLFVSTETEDCAVALKLRATAIRLEGLGRRSVKDWRVTWHQKPPQHHANCSEEPWNIRSRGFPATTLIVHGSS